MSWYLQVQVSYIYSVTVKTPCQHSKKKLSGYDHKRAAGPVQCGAHKKSRSELFFFPLSLRRERRSKTYKRLQERFLIRRNRTKRAHFWCNHLSQATYNTTENSSTNLSLFVRCQEAGRRKRAWDCLDEKLCVRFFPSGSVWLLKIPINKALYKIFTRKPVQSSRRNCL